MNQATTKEGDTAPPVKYPRYFRSLDKELVAKFFSPIDFIEIGVGIYQNGDFMAMQNCGMLKPEDESPLDTPEKWLEISKEEYLNACTRIFYQVAELMRVKVRETILG